VVVSLFRAVVDRLKLLLATAAAQEVEADFLTREAERNAELMRQAGRYDAEGLADVAQQLRRQTEDLSTEQPLGVVLPALAHWQRGYIPVPIPAPPEAVPLPAPVKSHSRKAR
jgi:hypothetical protein